MNRFWLFAYDTFYPNGGLGDRLGTYATLEEAKAAGRACDKDTWYIHNIRDDITEYADCDEPLPVNLIKPSPDDDRPLYMSLPVATVHHGRIDYGLPR